MNKVLESIVLLNRLNELLTNLPRYYDDEKVKDSLVVVTNLQIHLEDTSKISIR